MKDYISIDGKKFELDTDKMSKVTELLGIQIQRKTLAEYRPGEIVKLGRFELIVLEQRGGETSLILKGTYGEDTEFGENNNYNGSYVDQCCCEFGEEVAELVGEENLITHSVDLSSLDGLKCYGTVERLASSITADMYRKFVEILDLEKLTEWWWLATPWSTSRHDNERWALCVSPSGNLNGDCYGYFNGVRPFCILKSSIFVSG